VRGAGEREVFPRDTCRDPRPPADPSSRSPLVAADILERVLVLIAEDGDVQSLVAFSEASKECNRAVFPAQQGGAPASSPGPVWEAAARSKAPGERSQAPHTYPGLHPRGPALPGARNAGDARRGPAEAPGRVVDLAASLAALGVAQLPRRPPGLGAASRAVGPWVLAMLSARRTCRHCHRPFTDATNGPRSCRSHPGTLISDLMQGAGFALRWTCCNARGHQRLSVLSDHDSSGCHLSRHEEAGSVSALDMAWSPAGPGKSAPVPIAGAGGSPAASAAPSVSGSVGSALTGETVPWREAPSRAGGGGHRAGAGAGAGEGRVAATLVMVEEAGGFERILGRRFAGPGPGGAGPPRPPPAAAEGPRSLPARPSVHGSSEVIRSSRLSMSPSFGGRARSGSEVPAGGPGSGPSDAAGGGGGAPGEGHLWPQGGRAVEWNPDGMLTEHTWIPQSSVWR